MKQKKEEAWRGSGNCDRCIGYGRCRDQCLAHRERVADQQTAQIKKALLMQLMQKEAVCRG